MIKADITERLVLQHRIFIKYIESLSNAELEFAKPEKWTAAQQVQHIFKSVRPLAIGLQLPKFAVKMIWGKANRNSKNYESLVERYNEKLALGGRASSPFVPKFVAAKDVALWNKKIETSVAQLVKNLDKFKEDELDLFILPHPLLGKVTIKEMMYFTIYHVQHHQDIIARDLNKR